MGECQRPTQHTLVHGEQRRHYYLRLPACSPTEVFPLLVLIHCFGCSARMELDKYAEAADAYGFALAVPQGVDRSWNAPSCCGPAMSSGLDDVGFVDAMVADVSRRYPLAPRALFAAGFSNGGFLSSHLPTASRHRWAAISTAAGHEYSVRSPHPLPVYMHHCETDEKVLLAGCCASSGGDGRGCCCGIGRTRDTCVSAHALHADWLRLNRCRSSRTEPGPAGASCVVGVECSANATLCVHGNGCGHSDWVDSFPAASAVLEFFAREACTAHGGRWHKARCACAGRGGGRWCLGAAGGAGASGVENSRER